MGNVSERHAFRGALLVCLVLAGAAYARMYDAATVETLSGDVVRVETIAQGRGGSYGIHLVLRTEKEEIPVHLGPSWYVEKQAVSIGTGDKVTVRGSRVIVDGSPAVIAAEVRKGESVLTLRDAAGTPAWSAGGRGR